MTNINIIGNSFTSNKPYLFRALFEWILDNEGTPYLLVDAMDVDVQVPRQHVKDGQIVLNAAPTAVQNWISDNDAVSFNARFSGKAQTIYIPMRALKAVYAQENGVGMVFPEDDLTTYEIDENQNKTADAPQEEMDGDKTTPISSKASSIKSDNQPKTKIEKNNSVSKISHLKIVK